MAPVIDAEQVGVVLARQCQLAMPLVLDRLVELARDPRTRACDLAFELENDASLAERILGLANSTFYGYPHTFATLVDACMVLGCDAIAELAMIVAVAEALTTPNTSSNELQGLWTHAVGMAITSEQLARHASSSFQADAFSTGLLHSLGKLVMASFFPELCTTIMHAVKRDACLWEDVETRFCAGGHVAIGIRVAELWRLPKRWVVPLGCSAASLSCERHEELCAIVRLAAVFARALDIGEPGDPGMPAVCRQSWDRLRLDEPALDELFARVLERYRQADPVLGLIRVER